jgi:NAD(P)-dependent dehydrogenase (short-subunit alcohol dehydrogenase family)
MTDFTGKVALITGGTRGIGFGIAQEIVARGGSVCVTARKPDELEQAVRTLDPDGSGRAISARGSADDEAHQDAAISQTIDAFGRLNFLVNNAAVNPYYGPTIDADLGAVRKIIEVNVVAVLSWTQKAWRAWLRDNGGAVVNIASVGGLRAGGPLGSYGMSKSALIYLTKQLSREMAPQVRVNAIAPAVVKTYFARALYEGNEEAVANSYAMKRLGTPEDTAKLTTFLLSDDASWITGETVVIDGGGGIG